jgi:uncharacterized protein with NAD-binding domain and iron-sulfur cluster
MPRVAVLGGGVAGLTAADELSQRNFKVDLFERRDQLGGKARSFPSVPIEDLGQFPAEHGFRFIPGFYKHLPDTMGRIPYGGNSTVEANLVEARYLALLRSDGNETVVPASAWGFLDPGETRLRFSRHPFVNNFDLSHEDLVFLTEKLIGLLCTSHERRLAELEKTSWWDYCDAEGQAKKSPGYPIMMRAITRSLVAARADEMSARTGGDILVQLQLAEDRFRGHPDRLLNGPTSDVWIEPWRQKLTGAGVTFNLGHEVTGFDLDGHHLTGVKVKDAAGEEGLAVYDWYVCALPVEVMQRLVDDNLKEAAPSLANLDKLCTRWMNGFMLYLRHNFDMVEGHSIYIESPWALTSVSQVQFWASKHLTWRIPGVIDGILSIDISDWDTPGQYVPKKAVECSAEEIKKEVLGQLREYSRGQSWESYLSDNNIAGFSVDPDIKQPNPGGAHVNLEPLLINTVGSWASRPNSCTEIDNLFMAADYVRTYTDLATMEGANEAARRAVNHILEAVGTKHNWCELWPLHEPSIFAYKRHSDKLKFQQAKEKEFTRAREMLEALHTAHAHHAPRPLHIRL